MGKNKEPKFSLVDELKESSLEAFGKGHCLHSAIIIFQTVECLLRIAINAFGRAHGVSEDNLKKVADEISFYKLVLNLEVISPKNGLGERLYKFGNLRNSIMHRLFTKFETLESLKEQVNDFCIEGVKLNEDLRNLMGVDQTKI